MRLDNQANKVKFHPPRRTIVLHATSIKVHELFGMSTKKIATIPIIPEFPSNGGCCSDPANLYNPIEWQY
jgi:hypothetical protein